MSRMIALALLGALLQPGFARAAEGLEALRAKVHDSQKAVAGLLTRQAQLRTELNQVSTEADGLKKRRGLLQSSALDAALRRSQELSGNLTEVARSLATEQTALRARSESLVVGLREELRTDEALWTKTSDRPARRALVERMRNLQRELGQVQGSLPPKELPAVAADVSTENPMDLLEQADALRDAQDKAREQLKQLDTRLREARDEHELDRRMNEFAREDDLFDEQVQELKVTSSSSGALAAPSSAHGGATATGSPSNAPAVNGAPGPVGAGSLGGTPTAAPSTQGPVSVQDHRPEADSEGLGLPAAEAPADLKALEQRRLQLQAMVRELEQRARAAEARAHALQ